MTTHTETPSTRRAVVGSALLASLAVVVAVVIPPWGAFVGLAAAALIAGALVRGSGPPSPLIVALVVAGLAVLGALLYAAIAVLVTEESEITHVVPESALEDER